MPLSAKKKFALVQCCWHGATDRGVRVSGTGGRRTVQRMEAEAALEGVQARVGRLALQQAHQLRGLGLAARHGALEVHRAPDLQVALACTPTLLSQVRFPRLMGNA